MVSAVMAGESMVARPLPFPFIKTIEVEPVGRWFLSHWERLESGRGLSEAGTYTRAHSYL